MRTIELLFPAALVLYTLAIGGHRRVRELRPWMVIAMGAGLAADLGGTILLCVFSAKGWTWTLHTVSGTLSIAIMAAHFCWALGATRIPSWARWFDRWSLWAWGIWLVSFLSGIPLSHH